MKQTPLKSKRELIDHIESTNRWSNDKTKTYGSYNPSKNELILSIEVVGTAYEGRTDRIENVSINDEIILLREKDNKYNTKNIAVLNKNKESLGNLSENDCEYISPLIDSNILEIKKSKVSYVEPLSKRSKNCKKALLYIEITMSFKEETYTNDEYCTLCLLEGDQTHCWVQKLNIIKCNIPTKDAKLLFEIYNRIGDEYNSDADGYFGLDNLREEVMYHRKKIKEEMVKGLSYDGITTDDDLVEDMLKMIKKEPDRYKGLDKYLKNISEEYGYITLKHIFMEYAVSETEYYWIDQCQVSKEEWEAENDFGFNHWYSVVELYDAESKLPFDLSDEDIVTIFGFNKFIAFADLSYGC